MQAGYEVVVATRVVNHGQRIQDQGFRLIPLSLVRQSYSLLRELRTIRQLRKVYKTESPVIAHHVGLKPILYGSVAALGRKDLRIINAFAGLGYLGASTSLKARLLRLGIWTALRFLLNRPNCHVLLQNRDDSQLITSQLKVAPGNVVVIRGSGVDVSLFRPSPEPTGVPIVLFASRMLWIKGIREFIEAATLLRAKSARARFVLAGDTDVGNPSSVPRSQLLAWQSAGTVEWWGHQEDMAQVYKQATLVCLPSHGGEGVPKALIEAAASGRAIVTTDVPGCHDIVRQRLNGILVEPKNAVATAQALEELLQDAVKRKQMAACGREIVVNEFSQEAVIHQTLDLYRELLLSGVPGPELIEASRGTFE